MIDFRVKLLYPDSQAPVKAHNDDACYDVFAHSFWVWHETIEKLVPVDEDEITMPQFERYLVKTGIEASVPVGYEVQVRPRSGLALKQGIVVVNSPGTIDAGYRNEYGVILMNTRGFHWPVKIKKGDRIAQLAIRVVPESRIVVVEDLDETERGADGFGSSGK